MNDAKYSILFMRDDLDVRRFRLNPFWLKALVVVLILLVVVAAGGIYFGATALVDNISLQRANQDLTRRLEEAEVRLTTLSNMEKTLESYDSRELQSLLSTGHTDSETNADEPEIPAEPTVDLSSVFANVDTGAVRLENVRLDVEGRRVQISFNLLNNLNNTQLSGDTHLALVSNDGRIVELEAKGADLSFQIHRRKPMRARVALPESLEPDNVFGLRLTVTREDGKVIFSETYPQNSLG
jgi:hypothetical protein